MGAIAGVVFVSFIVFDWSSFYWGNPPVLHLNCFCKIFFSLKNQVFMPCIRCGPGGFLRFILVAASISGRFGFRIFGNHRLGILTIHRLESCFHPTDEPSPGQLELRLCTISNQRCWTRRQLQSPFSFRSSPLTVTQFPCDSQHDFGRVAALQRPTICLLKHDNSGTSRKVGQRNCSIR